MRLTSRLINFDLVNDHLRKTEVLKEEFCLDGILICTALFRSDADQKNYPVP
jgi:hypothetical protein